MYTNGILQMVVTDLENLLNKEAAIPIESLNSKQTTDDRIDYLLIKYKELLREEKNPRVLCMERK
jgi:hypothetical protein